MKLLRLTLDNYRGVPDGAYSFTRPATGAPLDTVYVTGPAASGKTTFLEAIAALKESVAAWDLPPDPARLLRKGARSGKVEGTWLLTAEEAELAESREREVTTTLELGRDAPPSLAEAGLRALFGRYSHDPATGKIEYFPSNRRLLRGPGDKPPPVFREAGMRLLAHPDKYGFLQRALIDLALSDGMKTLEEATEKGVLLRSDTRDSLAPFRRDLAELTPNIRLLGVEAGERGPELVFERRDGAHLALDDLADSEKQAFLFAVTFRRVGLSRSIVLVDQPELHWHADAQLRFARSLGKLGAHNQIFLATGSPEVTRTAAGHEIIRLGA